jgi:hypothetical protein
VHVVAVGKPFKAQLTRLGRPVVGAYLAGSALKSPKASGLTAASNTHEISVLVA